MANPFDVAAGGIDQAMLSCLASWFPHTRNRS